ncbi:MAG: membrane protein insertion efficiency factor YidD [Candidatus Mcinerneyibacterium aminivorans]|uniref:Putative membrane protein insertion efficiency factor n=1 Tax=Candidatus Mcinerneyibacterium aminivorans TaxID=2703815 RepID=A0A5D0MDM0_9BACT|nr:MAG: membrane protein insertion efficiency factor YidD [Candidatus Mcinerneyibacterium aminivorans]
MLKKIFLLVIKFYRKFISPYTPKSCIYHPTCSEYTYKSITRFGPFKGLLLGIKRILKCTPFHSGGYDPVPNKKKEEK